LAPADKKLYALRDATCTTASIPLIASSIMSKKLASGADKIVLDVKVGTGAFMKTYEESKELAKTMVHLGKMMGKQTIAVLSNMDEPLGYAIGNALEVEDAINTLQGKGEKRFVELCVTLASNMVSLARNISIEEARKEVTEALNNGKAYQKFLEFVKIQQGKIEEMKYETTIQKVFASKDGYINRIDPLYLANIALKLGAGRMTKEDTIDPSVGIILKKKIGDYVRQGDLLLEIYHNKNTDISNVEEAFTYSLEKEKEQPIIYEIIS